MKFSHLIVPLTALFTSAWGLTAEAAPENRAKVSVIVLTVQAPNTPPAFFAKDEQDHRSAFPDMTRPVAVQSFARTDTGPNHQGLGFATGTAFARAEAGVLRASIFGEAQAVAQPGTNVGATAFLNSFAQFTDLTTFSSASKPHGAILHIVGSLILDGAVRVTNTLTEVHVGGSGFNPLSSTAEWVGTLATVGSVGTQKPALAPSGPSLPWNTDQPVFLPFDIIAQNGIETEIFAYLELKGAAGGSFGPCAALGGLCNVIQTSESLVDSNFSHTLAWGGVRVFADNGSGPSGPALSFTSTSRSGFNYALPFTAPGPLPATLLLFAPALAGTLRFARRKSRNNA